MGGSTGEITDVLGTYAVPGHSAVSYSLTLYPDYAFKMTYKGSASIGRCSYSGGAVTLKPEGGAGLRLDREGDRLLEDAPGGVTWDRV